MLTMPCCAIFQCNNKHEKKGELSFFKFPRNPSVLAAWMRSCCRKDQFNVTNARICSEHFLDSDYDSSYLVKASLMPDVRPHLKKDAVPTQKLPACRFFGIKTKRGKARAAQKIADSAEDPDPDDPAERRRRSRQLRRERQERKERKELVEKLLAEHEERSAEQSGSVEVIELVNYKAGVRRPRRKEPAAAGAGGSLEAADAEPAGGPSDDERPLADGADSDVTASPPPVLPATTARPGPAAAARIRASAIRQLTRNNRPNLTVERTKEILRLKMVVRKLESKCLQILSMPGAPGSDAGRSGGEGRGVVGEDNLAEGREGVSSPSTAAADGEGSLVVLRDDRGSKKLPTILTRLRQNQLSDDLSTLTPSSVREAQGLNHRLKVQFLNLQVAMLKWAIKNRRIRDARLKRQEADEQGHKMRKTVSSSRLRELLRLESAVKSMFTESQIRALTLRANGGPTSHHPPGQRKNKPQWGEEDLRRVLELRAISSDKVVDHVREKMGIPLPSMQTIRKRCYKSPELGEAYRDMLQTIDANQRRCDMCERQVDTIDTVIEAADEGPSGFEEAAPLGCHFLQQVPPPGRERPAGPRPRRRRPSGAGPVASKKVRAEPPPPDWPGTSDSEAELSDPAGGGCEGQGRLGGPQEDEPGWSRRPPPDPVPAPYRQWRRAWR